MEDNVNYAMENEDFEIIIVLNNNKLTGDISPLEKIPVLKYYPPKMKCIDIHFVAKRINYRHGRV